MVTSPLALKRVLGRIDILEIRFIIKRLKPRPFTTDVYIMLNITKSNGIQHNEGAHKEEPMGLGVSEDLCKLSHNVLMWEYECHNCHTGFEIPVPRGPKEEQAIRCPECSSKDIRRLNAGRPPDPACGG